ncbi:CE1759 family FMN reductase [Actinotalea subterranea]|uniref:CE1759 family FMN reductase n=1 Tax=Actinotalea subterranea TaxID=2607497 RepID=UPI0011ECCF7C|nr:CE1759 family FMN reductase [Actinotalea subterranea]
MTADGGTPDRSGPRRLAVVSSGLREPSSTRLLADRLADATARELRRRGIDVTVDVVELREVATDLTGMLLSGFGSAALRHAIDTVTTADGVIAVTPIFSGSYTGLFKTFFDVLEHGSLAGTPVLMGATAGTARHSLALEHAVRPLLSYLRAAVVPTGVFAATEDFGRSAGTADDDATSLADRVERGAYELAEMMASRGRRSAAGPVDPFALTADFASLLNPEGAADSRP